MVLGATAARTLLGSSFRATRERGQPKPWTELAAGSPLTSDDDSPVVDDQTTVVATIHPSAIVRIRESEDRAEAYDAFVSDLRTAATAL